MAKTKMSKSNFHPNFPISKSEKSMFAEREKTTISKSNFHLNFPEAAKGSSEAFIALCKTICVWQAALRNLNQFEKLTNSKFKFQECFGQIPPFIQMLGVNFAN